MKTLLFLYLSLCVFLPGDLHAYYSVSEMKADALKIDPSIKINVHKSGDQVRFTLALGKTENPDVYSHGSLELMDQNGMLLAKVEMRGEDIRRAVYHESVRAWGWENLKPAEVFSFTVDSRFLTQSKFWLETGPRNDEHGIAYGGGIIRWCYLKALVEAANDANKTSAASVNQPIRTETDRTSSASDKRIDIQTFVTNTDRLIIGECLSVDPVRASLQTPVHIEVLHLLKGTETNRNLTIMVSQTSLTPSRIYLFAVDNENRARGQLAVVEVHHWKEMHQRLIKEKIPTDVFVANIFRSRENYLNDQLESLRFEQETLRKALKANEANRQEQNEKRREKPKE